jgi:hypothetical protein
MALLPGARELLALHARELPQRDDLCGAFCGALALRAAGIERVAGEPVDQDTVALAAGTIVSRLPDHHNLPHGERGRRDYRLSLAQVEDAAVSGTTAGGVASAIEQLAGGALAAIPYSGPWTAETLGGLFETAARLERPAALIANLATRHLWGGRARVEELLDYLYEGERNTGEGRRSGPPPDWDVGHFVCVFGCARGPRGTLYGVADTYPSLGSGGVHVQPAERLAAAIERRDKPAGGVIVAVAAADAPTVRAGADAVGLSEGIWDNGTTTGAPRG